MDSNRRVAVATEPRNDAPVFTFPRSRGMAWVLYLGLRMETTSIQPPSARKWSRASIAGALLSAFLASLCCIGPLLFAVLGIGGAGLLVKFERFRPYFSVVTVVLLGLGFYFTYRKPKVVEGDACGCEHPTANRAGRVMLWIAVVLVAAFLAFPYIAARLFS